MSELDHGVRQCRWSSDQLHPVGQSDAKGAFLPRCRFSVDQQTGTLLDGNHVLNVFFNGAFWSRLLTALDAANLFATSMEKIGVLHQRLADLAVANPGGWRVSHSDIFLGEDFDTPAVPAPVAGRGRGRGRGGLAAAAAPAIPGPQDLLFLTQLPGEEGPAHVPRGTRGLPPSPGLSSYGWKAAP